MIHLLCVSFFFFHDTATTEIYTLSLHDALPIWLGWTAAYLACAAFALPAMLVGMVMGEPARHRSEEHTSELQSHSDLVCRLLLEKKKKKNKITARDGTNTERSYMGEWERHEELP